jgi:hypothetical protein
MFLAPSTGCLAMIAGAAGPVHNDVSAVQDAAANITFSESEKGFQYKLG